MAWIDVGANLLDPRFVLDDVLLKASQADISHILVIASTLLESQASIALCTSYNKTKKPSELVAKNKHTQIQLACTAGIHPHYADQTKPESWTKLKYLIADKEVSAIGECGLDFNRNFSTKSNQLYVFEQQLNIAAENNMGVYLHERDAFDAQIKLLEKYSGSLKFMVTHCFTGNKEQLSGYLSLGCFVGITGWLCDSKRGKALQEAVQYLPLSRLLLETDAPYLSPKNIKPRQSTNEPCYLPYIAQFFSELTSQSLEDVKRHAFENASSLFFSKRT